MSCILSFRIEALRQAMTSEQVQEFCRQVDIRCRAAYEVRADYFMKCVNSKTNRGRDQLIEVWFRHWLVSFLQGGD